MALDKFRTAIENAISVSVQGVEVKGIDGADVQSVDRTLGAVATSSGPT